jgi:hypothetical protein
LLVASVFNTASLGNARDGYQPIPAFTRIPDSSIPGKLNAPLFIVIYFNTFGGGRRPIRFNTWLPH